jgi:hypothetical protein
MAYTSLTHVLISLVLTMTCLYGDSLYTCREALHGPGEQYKLFWPEKAEVSMLI